MTPEQWEQIKRQFHAALEHEPAERPAFLARACADDGPLLNELVSLLASHDQAANFIETPASDVAAALLAEDQAGLVAGQTVGPYKIAGVLATGGMGEVYLADDARLGRKIALKLLPPQFTMSADRVRRFEQEARAASALNHPNIVTIHDIGQTDSFHFIATEFIDGETLREHMANARMTIREVLDVAAQVASALQAAHEAGDRLQALYVLAIYTGLRQGELLGLKWDDVDLEDGSLQVRRTLSITKSGPVFTSPKTAGSRRSVKLTSKAIAALKSHLERQLGEMDKVGSLWSPGDADGLIFASETGEPLDRRVVTKLKFKPLLKRAGLPEIRFHDLRHTCATLLLTRNVNPKIVSEMLGHASIAITLDTYSHVLPNMRDRAADAMEEALS